MSDNQTPGQAGQHYFAKSPQSASKPRQVTLRVGELEVSLWTDHGVFSHGGIDRGTRLLIKHLDVPPQGRVLDWGCGYGPIGIAVALQQPECAVEMVDINERACALAERNVQELNLDNVTVVCGEAPPVLADRSFDIIVSNPPLRAGRLEVEALIDDAARRLTSGGELWLVVRTRQGARRFLEYMAQHFPRAAERGVGGGFRVLWAQKAAE